MIQLTALGSLLRSCGIKLWDLGMFMPYKVGIGGVEWHRRDFLAKYKEYRDLKDIELTTGEKQIDVKPLMARHREEDRQRILRGGKEKGSNSTSANSQESEKEEKESESKLESDDLKGVKKPLSNKHKKRLARLERRRLAKEKAKKLKESGGNAKVKSEETAIRRNDKDSGGS